jgi:hypothetical protein
MLKMKLSKSLLSLDRCVLWKTSLLLVVLLAAMSSASSTTEEAPSCDADGLTNSHDIREARMETILREDWNALDPSLSHSLERLKDRKAHKCWHKHSTFLEHLLNTHNILTLWGAPQTTARMGLFHSAYSNSYVNLALLNPQNTSERQLLQDWIGTDAEELVYLFCSINRQELVVETLLAKGQIPTEGITVPHLRKTDETVHLDAHTLRQLIMFTMADISDQYVSSTAAAVLFIYLMQRHYASDMIFLIFYFSLVGRTLYLGEVDPKVQWSFRIWIFWKSTMPVPFGPAKANLGYGCPMSRNWDNY